MRKKRRFLSIVEDLECRRLMIGGATLQTAFPTVFTNGQSPTTIDLAPHFADTAINGAVVDMDTTLGHMYFQLDSGREPIPSANFLAYVNSGRYNGTVFDAAANSRSDSNESGALDDEFVQGGGFNTSGAAVTTSADLPINDTWRIEDSNGPGFLGMARVGNDPNSAKSEFFIDELDNSTLFDAKSSTNPHGDSFGGYTVFGQLVFKSISNATLSAIAGVTPKENNVGAPVYPEVQAPSGTVGLASVVTAQQALPLTFSVTTDNPNVTGTLTGTELDPMLKLSSVSGTTGTVNITVTATALDGSSSAVGAFAFTFDTTPPTAALAAAVNPPTFGDSAVAVSIDFSDNDQLDNTSIGDDDIVVIGPNSVSHPLIQIDQAGGTTATASTFQFSAPNTTFSFHDNGTYTIVAPAGDFADSAGNTNAATTLGTFTINIDGDGPTAAVESTGTAAVGASTVDFVVDFTDATAVDITSLSGHNLTVTGPGNQTYSGILSVPPLDNGPTASATYQFDLGHNVTIADNGSYSVFMPAGTVSDTFTNPSLAANIGTFNVGIETDPPIASLVNFVAPLNRATIANLSIEYDDASGVDSTSLASGNFVVIGLGGTSYPVTLATGGASGNTLVATYILAAPHGTFTPADDGTYNLVLAAGGVSDIVGNKVAATTFGSFTLDIDGTPPTATLSEADPVGKHSPFAQFIVSYSDDRAIGSSTLGNDDVVVTDPDGFAEDATLFAVNQLDAAHVDAIYRLNPPTGGFPVDETFTVTSNANAVTDDGGNPLAVTALGTFTVSADETAPAIVAAPPANEGGLETMDFTLTFTDATGVDVSSISAAPVTLTGPKGFSQSAVFIGTRQLSANSVEGIYEVTAPHHFFGIADNGAYTAAIPGGIVSDVIDNVLDATGVAFTLSIPKPPVAPQLVSDVSVTPKKISPLTNNVTTVKLTNVGTRAANGVAVVKLYASVDGHFDASDILISTAREKVSLKPNAAKAFPIKFTVPAKLATGKYQIIAVVDPNNTLAEQYATGHNGASPAVQITAPFLDLVPTIGNLPKVTKSGAKVPVTITLTNKGNINAKGNAKIQFYASPDRTLDTSTDLKLSVFSKPVNLAPGKSTSLALNFSVQGLGTDILIAVLSFPGDANAANNTVFSKGTISFD